MSAGDSLRRFLERLSALDEHVEVQTVVRDPDGESRYEWRARTLADDPFVDLHDDLTEAESSDDAHLLEPTGDDAAGRLEAASRDARGDETITVDPVDPDASDPDDPDGSESVKPDAGETGTDEPDAGDEEGES